MPTLIRLIVLLAVLAGLAFAAMVALTIFVDPGERETTVRIPTRDLLQHSQSSRPALPGRPDPAAPSAAP
jgi:hypothetical protein